MNSTCFKAILFLTLGFFGSDMATALDATRFQFLLNQQVHDAKLIGLVLCLGPLAGILVQPVVGSYSDMLVRRGVSRRKLLAGSVVVSLLSFLLFALPMNFWQLVLAIGLFYTCFNLVIVNYRAAITETTRRRSLLRHKGVVSGSMSLFSSLGCCTMFAMGGLWGGTALPIFVCSGILLLAFGLVLRYAPEARIKPQPDDGKRFSFCWPDRWSLLFYVLPWLNLVPAVENRLVREPHQKAIHRLFVMVFSLWLGTTAIKAFFVMFSLNALHLSFAQANLPAATMTLFAMLAALPLGRLADKLNNKRILQGAVILYGVTAFSGFFLVHSLAGAMVMMALLGIAFAGMLTMPLAILFKLCPARSEGTYLGLFNLFLCTPQVYSLLVTGWLADSLHDYRVILAVAAAACAMSYVVSTRLMTEHEAPVPVVQLDERRADLPAAANQ